MDKDKIRSFHCFKCDQGFAEGEVCPVCKTNPYHLMSPMQLKQLGVVDEPTTGTFGGIVRAKPGETYVPTGVFDLDQGKELQPEDLEKQNKAD